MNPCFSPGCEVEAVYEIATIQAGTMRLACRRHALQAMETLDPPAAKTGTASAEARFWSRVQREDTGCWTWTGRKISGSDETGGMEWQGEILSARRIAWALEHGHVPERHLRTRCRNSRCLNPAHAYERLDDELTESIVRDRRPGESIAALARRHRRPRESLSRYLSAR